MIKIFGFDRGNHEPTKYSSENPYMVIAHVIMDDSLLAKKVFSLETERTQRHE